MIEIDSSASAVLVHSEMSGAAAGRVPLKLIPAELGSKASPGGVTPVGPEGGTILGSETELTIVQLSVGGPLIKMSAGLAVISERSSSRSRATSKRRGRG